MLLFFQSDDNVTVHNSSSQTVYGLTVNAELIHPASLRTSIIVTFDPSFAGICIDDVQCETCSDDASCAEFVNNYDIDLPRVSM